MISAFSNLSTSLRKSVSSSWTDDGFDALLCIANVFICGIKFIIRISVNIVFK